MQIPTNATLYWDGTEFEVRDVTENHVVLYGDWDVHDGERREDLLHKRLVRRWYHDDSRSFTFDGEEVSIPEPN